MEKAGANEDVAVNAGLGGETTGRFLWNQDFVLFVVLKILSGRCLFNLFLILFDRLSLAIKIVITMKRTVEVALLAMLTVYQYCPLSWHTESSLWMANSR